MNLKEKIKNAQDILTEVVHVPQWDADVEVRTMSALRRAQLLTLCADDSGQMIMDRFHAGVLVACCFDPESGEKLFTDADTEWLMEKSSGAIDLLATKAMELSGLTPEVVKAIEKNS